MAWVAAVQMASGPNVAANLGEAERLIAQAVDGGARLVVLPENFAHMPASDSDRLAAREPDGAGPIQDFLANQAHRHRIWVVGGTVPIACQVPSKVRAACLLFNASGERVARYDKVHLFDVTVRASQEERYAESTTIDPGDGAVVADTPFGKLGLAVCYDLRFPELFRCMLARGMELVAVPSAFTAVTGRAHWEILVRARAVENLCYVVAADQGGYHVGGRETFGNSMIVDPWGSVLAQLPRGPGVINADIDLERVSSIRRRFPAVEHRRIPCA
jgi:nitrilase